MIEQIPQRVLMTADTLGGVWVYALELIRAFEEHNVDVVLATMGAPLSKDQRTDLAHLHRVELLESNYKLEWTDDPWSDVEAAGEWLLGLESRFHPDIIHLNGYVHGNLGWQAPVVSVGHSCVLSWWHKVKGEHAPAEWETYRCLVRRGLRAAQHVIAPSGAMLNCLLDFYGPLPSVQVIPNGRRVDLFTPGRKEAIVLSAGRLWDEAKNVRAVCACSLQKPWEMCIAGGTNHPNGTRECLENVRHVGKLQQTDLADFFSRASIFAHPAKYEPFGLCVLEAALSQCALVLGDIPSLRENWSGAAVFVEPTDRQALQQALNELTQDASRRARLGRLARERALQFDIRITARRYLDAYNAVLQMHAPVEEGCAIAV
jgi:glycogen synthase